MLISLSDFISRTTPAGAALFLRWEGYHVFSIPRRELTHGGDRLRFFGVGGKRRSPDESWTDCALRESAEEIGAVVSAIHSAEQTYFLSADGQVLAVRLLESGLCPRLILEKRAHSSYGSLASSQQAYYLLAFDASLRAKPQPSSEIAALLYLRDEHLQQMQMGDCPTLDHLLGTDAKIDLQPGIRLSSEAVFVPHGTAAFLTHQGARSWGLSIGG
ncbi:NUDIX hydrolase [Thermoleptolyngbya sp. M55_K2018_002]|uniref:NUDIX hydrolase n=1 Tax=Thermoleptolyngbya sp. M55_K2018_002 TaxID=2747808 RepID=UPI001A04E607|nr:NUDIX hydrolase [Thermoleptolyngbya sp. M55_K2018_002]HIK43205.1 NUDIX hydrolase [Thermoleptolyngbya sp. M55_K2018_002]